jgi:hypothetical protein
MYIRKYRNRALIIRFKALKVERQYVKKRLKKEKKKVKKLQSKRRVYFIQLDCKSSTGENTR